MKLFSGIIFVMLVECLYIKAQQVDVKVVFNNTEDLETNIETIKKIKSAVKTTDLLASLQNNGHITDKNLSIRVAFFDRGTIGQITLKAEHELTPEKYIEKWQETVKNKSGILFLFIKNKGTNEYTFYKLIVSGQLEDEHLFPLVTEFINEHLSGSSTDIVENGTKYLAKAITPVWTESKRKKAEDLLNDKKYYRHYFNYFNGWWNEELLDLEPINYTYHFNDTNFVTAYFRNEKINDTLIPIIPVYIDKTEFKKVTVIESNTDDSLLSFIYADFFKKGDEKIVLLTCNQKFYGLMEFLNSELLYGENKFVSKWDWKLTDDGSFSLNSRTGLREYTNEDCFILKKIKAQSRFAEGSPKPPWISSYRETYCNIFALDLAHKLFGDIFGGDEDHYGPWGLSACANRLHYTMYQNKFKVFKNININAKLDSEKDAWDYTEAGYVVYLTAFGNNISNSYLNVSNEKNVPSKPSGHIATCYNENTKEVIQAGAFVGLGTFNSADKANIYLGYILK